MDPNIPFKDIFRGINIISEFMADRPGLLLDITHSFNLGDNFFSKVLRLNDGDLERAMREVLYKALAQTSSWETFVSTLEQGMHSAPVVYQRLICKYNIHHIYLTDSAMKKMNKWNAAEKITK